MLAYQVGAYWHGLANNGMTDEQRLELHLNPNDPEVALRIGGSKTQVAGWSTYTFLLWVVKAAMCTFYLRLTEGLKHMKMRIYVGFALIVGSYIVVICSILFGCWPLEKNWQIYPDPGSKFTSIIPARAHARSHGLADNAPQTSASRPSRALTSLSLLSSMSSPTSTFFLFLSPCS